MRMKCWSGSNTRLSDTVRPVFTNVAAAALF
jgi:hypothetical protein